MSLRLVLAALAVVALAQPAAAHQHAAGAKKPAKTCRDAPETGSILPSRICHTAEQWAQIDGKNSDDAHDTMQHIGQPTNQAHH